MQNAALTEQVQRQQLTIARLQKQLADAKAAAPASQSPPPPPSSDETK